MKRKILPYLSLIFLIFSIPAWNTVANAQTFLHPGVPFTRADLDQLKANITKEPWLTGYNALKGDSHSQLTYGIHGPFATVTRAPNLNNSGWRDDMNAIHNLAFMYVFTGDSAYARKATNMLDAWAVTNTVWGGGENMLDIGDMAPYFVAGADILRSTFPGWTPANDAHVNNYFRNVLYPTSWVPNPLRDCNKGALQLQIAVGIAAYLGDSTLWNNAITVYRMDAGGGLRASLPNGEVGDSGRDDHWWVEIQALGWSAEVAWKQGIDLFAEFNNRLLAISELYSQYSQAPTTVSFLPFGGYSNYWGNWGVPPGNIRQSPFNNIIKAAYSLRKGIADPYTEQMRALAGEGAWSFLYLKSSDTSHATPLTPVIYPATLAVPVSSLSNIDIGSTGIAGSANYNNNIWTINGAGTSAYSATNFTFKPIHGDVGIVVKVESSSLSSANTGVMIRSSLASNSSYVSVSLNGSAVTAGASGQGAQSAYVHYIPRTTPWWLKVERVGNRVFTYHSQDGVSWTNNAMYLTTIPADAYIGLYTVSNNTSALNTATFSNVAINNTSPAGSPDISSTTTATATLGTVFSYVITANGNPTSYTATALPAGLSLDTNTGIISGTPTATGTTIVTLGATNANGTGTASLVITIADSTVPSAITNLSGTVVNSTSISLAWAAATNATSYNVKRSLSPTGPFTTIQSGVVATSYVDANPVPEVNNYYVVTALAGTQETGNSNVVFASVPPAAPAQPIVVNKNKEIDLSWNSASGAATYNVKRATISGGPYTNIANVSTTAYADVNVSNGSPYYYVVSSVGQTKESVNSIEAYGVPGSSSATWSATPQTDSLKLASNWNENIAPVNPAIINFHSSIDTTLVNDINGLVVSRMQFNTDASSPYTITGNSIHLKNDLVNTSSATHTLSIPVILDTLLNVNAVGSGGRVALTGVLSGNGSLVKNGIGFLALSGANTYTGNTTLNGNGQSWPPVYGIEMAGTGTGTTSIPTSGALGTGKIIMNGGALITGTNATVYNDIVAVAGTKSYIYQTGGAMNLYGNITGTGTIWQDGNVTAGLHLYGDNSNFAGTFVSALRSGNSRTRFETPQSGSAKAYWNLDANGIDCMGVTFGTGTLNFGALSGRGYIRNDGGGSPLLSIGALNQSTTFGGTIASFFNIEKVGTGNLVFTGNHTYGGTTTVKAGKFLLNNDPVSGVFGSPVIVNAGSFGGTGKSTGPATIGTGSGPGAILEPGNLGVGTLIVSALTLNSDATYNAELDYSAIKGDKVIVSSAMLINKPALSITGIAGTLPLGTSFTIIDNTGATPVSGLFKNLPEMSLITAGTYNFRITYRGGTGNDVVLLDDRTTKVTITSALTDTAVVGRSHSYGILAIKSPNSFSATGLPAGLTLNSSTGVISGVPTLSGNFHVILTASNGNTADTITLALTVQSNIVSNVLAAAGDAKNLLEWTPIANFTYLIKRSSTTGGPYTTVGNIATSPFTDLTVSNGNTYYYVVSSVDSTRENAPSAEVNAKPNIGQKDYYKFDEQSGTKGIDLWGANHAVLAATATLGTGKYGQALLLNGTATSYAILPANIIGGLSDFTITTRVRMDAISTWMRVFDFGNSTTQYTFLTVQAAVVSGKSTVRFAVKNGSAAEQDLNFNYTFPLNTWTDLAITRSGNTCTMYINGASVASTTAVTIKLSDLGITTLNYLGKSQFTSDPMFKGSIDDFKIYSRALSAAEITSSLLGDQVITFNPIPRQYMGGPDFDPAAIASSGLGISYISSDTSIATIVNGKVHLKAVGKSLITATQGGSSIYKAATAVGQILTVVKNDQTISFATIGDKHVSDVDFDLMATASSGLAVSYSSSDTTVASIVGGKVHIKAAGTSIITASQAGDSTYAHAASVDQTLTIVKNDQTITFAPISAKHVGDADFDPLAMASSGLPVSYSSSDTSIASVVNGKLHIAAAGTSTISAAQTGNNMFNAATVVTQLLTVIKNDQSITFNAFPAKSVNDTDFVSGASVSSGLPLTYTSSDSTVAVVVNGKVHITGAGNTAITALQNGSSVYLPASPVTQSLTVNKLTQLITFNALPNKRPGDADVALTASASSGLPLTYTSSNSNVAVITNGKLHIIGVGTTTVTASQPGNATYSPATATQLFTVLPYNLQVQYLDGDNGQLNNNVIRPYIRIANQDSVAVAYNELTVRYWFTAENYAGINTWIDYAQLGNSNVAMNYVASQPRSGALGYMEYKILSSGNISPNSNSGPIQSRFANQDWSVLSEADDYSYQSNTGSYAANAHITMYRNGALIWGTEPAAITAVTGISVSYQNQNQTSSGNTISTYLSINNTGNVPVAYGDITARYWFTGEGTQSLNYWIDYAKKGSNNISGKFVTLSPVRNAADHYFEVAVNASAGTLYPLSGSGNIQYRIAKSNWSSFNEANDYSYAAKDVMKENSNITVYYKGTLIYGTEPVAISINSITANSKDIAQVPTQVDINKPLSDRLIIYPNPLVDTRFSVKLSSDLFNQTISVKIRDAYGKIMQSNTVKADGDALNVPLSGNYPPGVYFVQFNSLPSVRIMVNH